MKADERAIQRLNAVVAKALSGLNPPENITVTEWAEKYRRLAPESSSEPGLWRTWRTPYLRELMDAFTDPRVHRIVFVAASQIGKSEVELNILGYIIDEDPGSILFIHPTIEDAKDFSLLRIAPEIRDCPTLRRKVSPPKSRDSGNTILQKKYPGGILTLCGSTEAHALASKPVRYVLGDERDRWARSAGREGDPWGLAMARQTTFYNAKAVEVSTPTIKGASVIADSYAEGTMERWESQCPHCGQYHEIKWEHIRYEYETREIERKKTYRVTAASYFCPGCGKGSPESVMKRQPARWTASNPDAYQNGVRSFWLNAFVSPWASWDSIILKFLSAEGDPMKRQVVYNTSFGELWEDRGELEDEEGLLARRETNAYGLQEGGTPFELPDGVLVLTAGVDTQDSRMEYEVVGHGHFGETWGIEKGVVMGRPDDERTWAQLDEVLFDRVFHFADGLGLPVSLSFVDQAGHFSGEVRQACHERAWKRVYAIMGSKNHDAPFTAPPKEQKIVVQEQYLGTCWMYEIGVDAGKQKIMSNLRVKTPGKNHCHFPLRDDYGPAYFAGLLSERLTYDGSKKQPWVWKKIPGHERNEALDCRNYALAAFDALAKDLDAIDRRLKEARAQSAPQQKTAPASAPAPQQKTAPAPRVKQRQKTVRPSLERFYDPW